MDPGYAPEIGMAYWGKWVEGFWGWMGFGGSIFQWNPDLELSFAYVPADLMAMDGYNSRALRLQSIAAEATHDCRLREMANYENMGRK